jgi:hypothetical protein
LERPLYLSPWWQPVKLRKASHGPAGRVPGGIQEGTSGNSRAETSSTVRENEIVKANIRS